MNTTHCPIQCIVPPHILRNIITETKSELQRERAWQTLHMSDEIRGQRQAATLPASLGVTPASDKRRSVFDAQELQDLPGILKRSEGQGDTGDLAVDEAYFGSGATYDLFLEYGRNSIDDRGMRLDSTVHFSKGYDNAFWNGQQMVYGDGDEDLPEAERLWNRITFAVDIIGYELTHGVTENEAALVYRSQPGALNESFSDVFGSLVKQRVLKQTAAEADWLIGEGLFTANVKGKAIRSMKEPGTAFDDPVIGKDIQPGHMRDYLNGPNSVDHGGVHVNSGIPNHAFFFVATEMGGHAWEKAGLIWYITLRDRLRP